MYFTINTAFTNYLSEFNLMGELEIPILTNKSTSEITLPVFLNRSMFDDMQLSAPLTLKGSIVQYKHDKEIFYLKERHDIDELEVEFVSENFFTNNLVLDVFVFVIAIILVISTIVIIYAICKLNKLRILVTSFSTSTSERNKSRGY